MIQQNWSLFKGDDLNQFMGSHQFLYVSFMQWTLSAEFHPSFSFFIRPRGEFIFFFRWLDAYIRTFSP